MVEKVITIGIASWNNPEALRSTLKNIQKNTDDFECWIYDNASDAETIDVINEFAADSRFVPILNKDNAGYVGAVNYLLENAETDYIAYVDNDCDVLTHGWDSLFIEILEQYDDLAMMFASGPGAGVAYKIPRGSWDEILWGVGCFWMIKKEAKDEVGLFDASLGHQEEVDYQTRLRLAGWKIGHRGDIDIVHHATASRNPEAEQRINQGIINWVNKWVKYFGGEHMDYYSPNVIRFADWPVNALYLEEWYKLFIPNVNDDPETVSIEGRDYHLIKVPRTGGGTQGSLYVGRII